LGAIAPSNRITMGFIGTGRQAAGANIPQFMALPEVQVVAVCDVDSWRLGQAREQVETYYARQSHGGDYKGCATFTDFRELLARTDIDTVMISTPDHWHVPMAVAALHRVPITGLFRKIKGATLSPLTNHAKITVRSTQFPSQGSLNLFWAGRKSEMHRHQRLKQPQLQLPAPRR
jgi:hypothetical protein